jgi:hypothetical protein
MVEDQRYLAVLDHIAQELQSAIVEFNRKANGVTDRDTLISLRMEQNELLTALLKKHRRAMEFMQGKTVEPEMHFGEGVLLPAGGQG